MNAQLFKSLVSRLIPTLVLVIMVFATVGAVHAEGSQPQPENPGNAPITVISTQIVPSNNPPAVYSSTTTDTTHTGGVQTTDRQVTTVNISYGDGSTLEGFQSTDTHSVYGADGDIRNFQAQAAGAVGAYEWRSSTHCNGDNACKTQLWIDGKLVK